MSEEKKRVKFEDVVNALTKDANGNDLVEPIDPFETNAKKVRGIIGSGGQGTIQKHLETIRENSIKSKIESLDNSESVVPNAPKDLVESLWSSAWKSAQVATLSRIERLTVERDGLQLKTGAQENDINELTANVDELEEIIQNNTDDFEKLAENNLKEIELINSESEKLNAELQEKVNSAEDEIEKIKVSLIDAERKIDDLKKDALHKEELSISNEKLVKATMQSTIDHLNEKVSELKAMRISELKDMKEVDISSK